MTVRLSHRLRRFAFRCLLASALAWPAAAMAVPVDHCGFHSATQCEFELADTEELCGWSNLAKPTPTSDHTVATHDSTPFNRIASVYIPTFKAAPEADDNSRVPTVAEIAAAACERAGVSLQQIAEPFAMVGPEVAPQDSIISIATLEQWWQEAKDQAQQLNLESSATVSGPIDTDPVTQIESVIEITPIDLLVGSSPMIATLEEEESSDHQQISSFWNLYPTAANPFCVRGHAGGMIAEYDPMWSEFDAAVAEPTSPSDLDVMGSADCMLDHVLCQVSGWLHRNSEWVSMPDAELIGARIAELAMQGNRIAKSVAIQFACQLSDEGAEEQEEATSPVGAALLARAGALEEAAVEIANNSAGATLR